MSDKSSALKSYFAWDPKDDPDFTHMIYGSKTIGGKGRSLLFGLRKLRDSGDSVLAATKVPESIYFGIDLFHQFLDSVPHFETLMAQNDPERIESVFLSTPLPDIVSSAVRKFLSEIKDPVVVRSSSRLEDSIKHSFAGKYLSTFLSNSLLTLDERARMVEDDIKRIYARTYFPKAVGYRKKHGLGDDDMGIILIRMAGKWHGQYYYPTTAGVGYSQNFRRWNTRIKQEDGVLRIVFGLGTMSTKRGYARTISLTNPNLRPEGQSPDKIASHAQETFHVIDAKHPDKLTDLDIKKQWNQLISYHPDYAAYAQLYTYEDEEGMFMPIMKNMKGLERNSKICLTFENFPKMYPKFFLRMKDTLRLLENSMGVPADIEYAYEPTDDSLFLIQSRPFWCQTCLDSGIPDLAGRDLLLAADRMVTPGCLEHVHAIVYIDHNMYFSCPDFYAVARSVGYVNESLSNTPYILVCPGRIGSSNPALGVPVQYDELTNCRCIVELGIQRLGFMPELSYGTHFFSDLEVDNVLYMPVFEGEQKNVLNRCWFEGKPFETGPHPAIRIYRGDFSAYMDGETNQGVVVDNGTAH